MGFVERRRSIWSGIKAAGRYETTLIALRMLLVEEDNNPKPEDNSALKCMAVLGFDDAPRECIPSQKPIRYV